MKIFVSVLAALLCAAAVLFGVQAYRNHNTAEDAKWASMTVASMDNLTMAAKLCVAYDKPTLQTVETFRDQVERSREVVAHAPDEVRGDLKRKVDQIAADVRGYIEVKYPELAPALKGV